MQCLTPQHFALREGKNLAVSIGAVRDTATQIIVRYLAQSNRGLATDYRPLTIDGKEVVLSKDQPQLLLQLPGNYMFDPVSREKPDIFIVEFDGPAGKGGPL